MAPGQPFIDFEGEDMNGNKVKLSDYVGKGKYVIVDFSEWFTGQMNNANTISPDEDEDDKKKLKTKKK